MRPGDCNVLVKLPVVDNAERVAGRKLLDSSSNPK